MLRAIGLRSALLLLLMLLSAFGMARAQEAAGRPLVVGSEEDYPPFATGKHDAMLLVKVNEGVALAKSSGADDALSEKWFGVFETGEVTFTRSLKYLVPIASALLIAAAIFFVRQHERRKAQARLRASEEQFRAIFHGTRDGILLADVVTKKFYLGNGAICQMLGYPMDELTTMGVEDIHPREDLPYLAGQFANRTPRGASACIPMIARRPARFTRNTCPGGVKNTASSSASAPGMAAGNGSCPSAASSLARRKGGRSECWAPIPTSHCASRPRRFTGKGLASFLQKPFTVGELRTVLQALLG